MFSLSFLLLLMPKTESQILPALKMLYDVLLIFLLSSCPPLLYSGSVPFPQGHKYPGELLKLSLTLVVEADAYS